MKKKPPILLIAGILGVIAIGGTAALLLYARGGGSTPAPEAGATDVALAAEPTPAPEMRYIANRDIPPRTVITADMMRRSAVSGAMPPGAITSLDEVRGMLTGKMIRSGDTITKDSLMKPLDRAILANFTIPSGFRAVAIYVDPLQTAAGLVDVGDRVDVIATKKLTLLADKPDERILGAKELTAGRTVAVNLLVLAVDASLAAPIPTPTPLPDAPAAGAAPADAAPPPAGAAPAGGAPAGDAPANGAREGTAAAAGAKIRVLLAAPLETASRLVTANEDGNLHLLVRNPLDGDAERAPETREYPGRVIIDPSLREKDDSGPSGGTINLGGGSGGGSGGGGGGGGGPAFPVPDLPPVTVSQDVMPPMPMPVAPSAPSGDSGGMGMSSPVDSAPPPEQATKDVMVVRGTEKTLVLVPKR